MPKTTGKLPATPGSFEPIAITVYPDGRVDARNAALYIGLKEKTLAMMRTHGTGPRFIKRGRIFYFVSDLDEWLQARLVTSTAQLKAPSGKGG